ncbi:MAG TPA: anaerobic glycerol-3-phosphate dehydrogenase subunit A [Spirochaetota bacterium]|nr:anaerobic glycerol-3-phosphate dehydrogenase subunit A [Spirochaetota bacterium]
MKTFETDVIVIGGGATGTGTLRDCALRGMKGILIEKNDIASGTTGRNHGLLHSGARYAVKDLESASECISENKILKKIAWHCIEDTGGLFVTLPEDDPAYHNMLMEGCSYAGIDVDEISINKALEIEPNLNPNILYALKVPDGTIDPFRLSAANILDSTERGSKVFTHTDVTSLIQANGRVTGVRCYDKASHEEFEVYGKIVVNASGVWGQQVCESAGIELKMFPSKGSMVIIDYRINNVVVNRCRIPSDGDIIVPGDTVSLIGTTSRKIDYDRIEELVVDDDEIEVLLEDGEKLIPNVKKTRVLRAYCGVRPLVAVSGEMEGRDISRGIVLIDHKERDGVEGLITIAGGKLMTYRLMAQMTTDLVGKKLGVKKKCSTHKVPLPGSEKRIPHQKKIKHFSGISNSVVGSTHYRHGERVHNILRKDKKNYGLICECEMVTAGEVEYAIKQLHVKDIVDLRRRTRVGMGPCQGELCSYRAAGLFTEYGDKDGTESTRLLMEFLEERWKGIKPVFWGDAMREIEFTYWIYQGLFGLGNIENNKGEPDR